MAKNKDTKSWRFIINIVVVIAVGALLAFGLFGTSVKVNDDMLRITGLHSQKIQFSEMASVELKDELPTITARTGGFSLGGKRLGNFTTTEYGKVKLFLFNNIGPFIYVEKDDGEMIILNTNESSQTQSLYNQLPHD